MKKFIKNLLLFSIPICILFSGVEIYLRTIPSSYQEKMNRFYSIRKDVKTIVLGSSLAYFGVNPEYFDEVGYNMGNVSQSLEYDYKILYNHINEMENLSNAIIVIGYFSLESSVLEEWRKYEYIRHYDFTAENVFDVKNYSLSSVYLAGNRLGTVLFNSSYYDLSHLNEFGWYNISAVSECGQASIESGKARLRKHNASLNITRLSMNRAYLDSVVEICLKKEITPTVVLLPVYKTYSQNINEDVYNRLINNCIEVKEKYDVNFYNYFFDNRFTKDDFQDNDHLCATGAEKISKIINVEILR